MLIIYSFPLPPLPPFVAFLGVGAGATATGAVTATGLVTVTATGAVALPLVTPFPLLPPPHTHVSDAGELVIPLPHGVHAFDPGPGA